MQPNTDRSAAFNSKAALHSWESAKNSAYLYRVMRGVEPDTRKRELFSKLADEAESQALSWAKELQARAGAGTPAFHVSLRVRLTGRLVRLLGVRRSLSALAALKVCGLSVYRAALSEHPMPTIVGDEAGRHRGADSGGSLRAAVFGVNDGLVSNLSVILGVAGDVPTLETLVAVELLRKHLPELTVRVVNIVDVMTLQPQSEHPHRLSDRAFDSLFTRNKPVIFAFHGYPWLIHRLTYRRTHHENLDVRGYKEEGTTTTPFDMVVLNDLDRFHLAGDVIDRVPHLGPKAAYVKQALRDKLLEHKEYITTHGEDMPEIRNWKWRQLMETPWQRHPPSPHNPKEKRGTASLPRKCCYDSPLQRRDFRRRKRHNASRPTGPTS